MEKIRDEDNAPPESEATTWEPINLMPWLDGSLEAPKPAVGISRTDGVKLLYPGLEHTVFGETEAGKSWLALECAAVEIRMDRGVVYVHYEEGNPASTIERLEFLGCTRAEIARNLRFAAPARPVQGDWLTPLLDPPPVLVIHDGVNEAMSLHGDGINDADGAARFRRTVIKPFTAVGATSLSCDHVTKNGGENRGRYAAGSGHKVNALDGVAILMENIEPFGRGLRGASSVYVTKDRPGQLRAAGSPTKIPGKTLMGVLTVDATGNSPDFLVLFPPSGDGADGTQTGGTDDLADQLYQVLAAQAGGEIDSSRQLFAAMRASEIKFTDKSAREALDDLLFKGRVVKVPGPRGATGYRAVKPGSSSAADSPPGEAAA